MRESRRARDYIGRVGGGMTKIECGFGIGSGCVNKTDCPFTLVREECFAPLNVVAARVASPAPTFSSLGWSGLELSWVGLGGGGETVTTD